MNADTIFSLSGMLALAGWLSLLASPLVPRLADRIAGLGIPALLAVAYTGLVLAFWSSAKGGFDSLDNVAALFQTRELLLAGWIHYLAFDLVRRRLDRARRTAGRDSVLAGRALPGAHLPVRPGRAARLPCDPRRAQSVRRHRDRLNHRRRSPMSALAIRPRDRTDIPSCRPDRRTARRRSRASSRSPS